MVLAWHSNPIDSSLLMQRQTIDLTPRLFQWSLRIVKAHHYIISFEPTDVITMEQALEFGKQWLSVFVPGHQAVLAVHPDGHNGSQNMHAHIVINSGPTTGTIGTVELEHTSSTNEPVG